MAEKNSNTDLCYEVNGVKINQRKDNGYVNATAMSKSHNTKHGENKTANDWLSQIRNVKTIAHLAFKLGIFNDIPAETGLLASAKQQGFWGLVIVKKGGNDQLTQGTWLHPKLATRFAIWLSDDFGFIVEEWVETWLTTGKNPVQNTTRQDIINSLIPAEPFKWEKRFEDSFWENLLRISGYKQGNPACGRFIRKHIYDYFDKDVRDRLDEVNPLIKRTTKKKKVVYYRDNKVYQHFYGDLRIALERHIVEVTTLMQASASMPDFEYSMLAKFRGIYNLKIPGF